MTATATTKGQPAYMTSSLFPEDSAWSESDPLPREMLTRMQRILSRLTPAHTDTIAGVGISAKGLHFILINGAPLTLPIALQTLTEREGINGTLDGANVSITWQHPYGIKIPQHLVFNPIALRPAPQPRAPQGDK